MSSDKERTILLFNSTILQGHCHFAEELFNFEPQINNCLRQRSTTEEKREIETDSMN